ncbi:unnamed protein product, partial [Hymenolepis diminuta]
MNIYCDFGVKPRKPQYKFPWDENIFKNRKDALSDAENNECTGNSSLRQTHSMKCDVKNATEAFNETSLELSRHKRTFDSRRQGYHKCSEIQKSKSLSEPLRNSSPSIPLSGRQPLRQIQSTSSRDPIFDDKFRSTTPSSWFQNKKIQTDFPLVSRKRLLSTDSEQKYCVMPVSNKPNVTNDKSILIETNSGEMDEKISNSKQCCEIPDSQPSYTEWRLDKLQKEFNELSFRMDKAEKQLSSALRSVKKICEFMQKVASTSELKAESEDNDYKTRYFRPSIS